MLLKPDSTIDHVAAYPVVNAHLSGIISRSISASDGHVDTNMDILDEARTELDLHANICVFGKQALVINSSGRHAG
jgi:hypothetical protein